MYVKGLFEVFKILGRLGIKPKDVIGMGGDIVKMGKSLFNTRINPKLITFIEKNQKIPAKILEDLKLHARTLKNASENQKNLFLENIKSIYKAKTPPKLKDAKILDIKSGHKLPAAGIKQLETKVGYPKNVHPQSTLGKAIDESRVILSGQKPATSVRELPEWTKGWKPTVIKGGKDGLATGGIANHFRTR